MSSIGVRNFAMATITMATQFLGENMTSEMIQFNENEALAVEPTNEPTKNDFVTLAQITKIIDEAEKEEHVFFNKVVVIEYRIKNGFTIQGRGAVVNPGNFDLNVGRAVARENAINKMWQLEGYLLQQRLYEESQKA